MCVCVTQKIRTIIWIFISEFILIRTWYFIQGFLEFFLVFRLWAWIRLLEVRIVNCRPSWDGVDGDSCSYGVWWDCSQVCTTWEQAWVSLNWVHHFTFIFLIRSKEQPISSSTSFIIMKSQDSMGHQRLRWNKKRQELNSKVFLLQIQFQSWYEFLGRILLIEENYCHKLFEN